MVVVKMALNLEATLSVAPHPSVHPSLASNFLEIGKPQKLLI